MMGCFTATLGVIILLSFINLSASNKDTCNLYAAVGQNLTLPTDFEPLTETYGLKWSRNNAIVFLRERSKVSLGKTEDVSRTGSLLLKNLKFSDAGVYKADVLYPNGTSAKTWHGRLCVVEKVSKPQLSFVCDFKSNAVNLNCNVNNPQGLVFSWTLEERTIPREAKQTLTISLAQLKGRANITCSVANKGSVEKSDVVSLACKSSSESPSSTVTGCFTSKPVMAVLAGGAGLILLLFIIIIILCCRRKQTQMRPRNNVELRMASVKKQDSGSISPDYETMHAAEGQHQQSPKPSPRACYQNVSPAENKSLLSTTTEEQKPSPVPKPRKKSPLSTSQELVA